MTKEQAIQAIYFWGVYRSGDLHTLHAGPGNSKDLGEGGNTNSEAQAFACYMLVERAISRVHTWVYSPVRLPEVLHHIVYCGLSASDFVLMPPGQPYPHALRELGLTKEDLIEQALRKIRRALQAELWPAVAGGLPDVDPVVEAAG